MHATLQVIIIIIIVLTTGRYTVTFRADTTIIPLAL